MDEPRSSFSTMLSGLLQTAEKILLAGAALGLILKYMGKSADQILIISLSGLAGVYFLMAFSPAKPLEDSDNTPQQKLGFKELLFSTILPKIAGIGSAVAIIGVLFALVNFKGSDEMLRIGLMTSGAAAALILIGLVQGSESAKALVPLLYRLVPLAGISAFYQFK